LLANSRISAELFFTSGGYSLYEYDTIQGFNMLLVTVRYENSSVMNDPMLTSSSNNLVTETDFFFVSEIR